MRPVILVVDDEPAIRVALERLLDGRGYDVESAASGQQAIEHLDRSAFDLVITDLTLKPLTGMDVLAHARKLPADARPPVIMITAYGSERAAVEAMKLGAVDYLPKPFDNDELVRIVERALEERRLRRDVELLREQAEERYSFGNILGRSPAMQAIFEHIRKVAGTDLTVLIRGPSGTGKELVANAIHFNSPRRQRPLVKVNCAAFSRELVESELFGHEQGAFTGATRARRGKFEVADGGSLFLDEIGDMSPETQAKVLRVLQSQAFERVGGNRTIQVDVRILAATNQDLEAAIADGRFRRDLYYRLAVVPIELPPLKDRAGDLPLLIDHFLEAAAERLGRPVRPLSPEALRTLAEHPWEGNVRELEHAIEHAVALAGGDEIGVSDLPAAVRGAASPGSPAAVSNNFKQAKEQMTLAFERDFIARALERHRGNVTRAAEEIGMYRQQLQTKVAKLGIDLESFRQG